MAQNHSNSNDVHICGAVFVKGTTCLGGVSKIQGLTLQQLFTILLFLYRIRRVQNGWARDQQEALLELYKVVLLSFRVRCERIGLARNRKETGSTGVFNIYSILHRVRCVRMGWDRRKADSTGVIQSSVILVQVTTCPDEASSKQTGGWLYKSYLQLQFLLNRVQCIQIG